jgi:hypothetical protein
MPVMETSPSKLPETDEQKLDPEFRPQLRDAVDYARIKLGEIYGAYPAQP